MPKPADPGLLAQLLALLAHDLRNPLSALHSNAGYLQAAIGSESDDVREALDDVVSSCLSLGHIIDNLELLAVALEEPATLERGPLSISDIALDVVQQCGALAASYRVKLSLLTEPSGRACLVIANRDMLRRALSNVTRNAIQHGSREAGIEVHVSCEEGSGILRVEDGGEPLARELSEAAFTAAGQLESKSHPGGRYSRGLGLYAAAVAAHWAGAELKPVPPRAGFKNAFELRLPAAEL